MYKDRDSSSEAKKPEVIPLKNIPKIEDANGGTDLAEIKGESSGSGDQDTGAPKEIQTTPIVALRKLSRIPRPPQRYTLALHYILLTDIGDLRSYDEVVQDMESVKWELAMEDEMDFLMSN